MNSNLIPPPPRDSLSAEPTLARVLVVDDNAAIHDDFRKILRPSKDQYAAIPPMIDLFEDSVPAADRLKFELSFAHQGEEGVEAVQKAMREGSPFSLAFVDVRMPPGLDGVETTLRLWEVDPDLEVVICSAYSDHTWEDFSARLGTSDRLIILRKPFEAIEVRQLAHVLSRKRALKEQSRRHLLELEEKVALRTQDLMRTQAQLLEDVASRKRAESELRKLSLAVEQSPASVVITDLSGNIEYVNPKFCAVTGYSFDDVRGQNPRILKSGETPREDYKRLWRTITAGEEWRGEFRNRKKNGELYWETASISPIRDEQGVIAHFVAVKEDITGSKKTAEELKQTMDALRESGRFLQSTLNALSAQIAILDGQGLVVAVNTAWDDFACQNNFAGQGHGIGVNYLDLCESAVGHGAEEASAVAAGIRSVMAGWSDEFLLEYPCHSPQEKRWFIVRVTRFTGGSPMRLVVAHENITARKRVEEELRWKTALLEAQFSSSIDGILVVDRQDRKILQNQRMTDLFKIPRAIADDPDDQKQRNWVAQTVKDPDHFIKKVLYLNSQPNELSRDEVELKDGTILDRYTCPLMDRDGNYSGRMWTFRDITERTRAEKALQESKERFSSAFEHAPIGVCLVSTEGRLIKVNRALCDVVGYSETELLTRTFQELTHPGDLAADLENVRRLLAGEIRSYQMEKRYIHARGHFVNALLSVSLVRDGQDQPLYFISQIQDITERKNAARQLAEHQEREAASRRALEHERELNQIKSRFVSMVSHEFRTPLCVIGMAGSLLSRYLDRMTTAERSRQLEGIKTSVERMTRMMEDLLLYGNLESGKIECHPSRLDLPALCQRLIAEACAQYEGARPVECLIDPAAREACLDERILAHILGNLLSNALKYSSSDDPVNIEIKSCVGNPDPDESATAREPHIQIIVSDKGIGIPSADLSRLFRNFQRASNIGNRPGTGMGLAIVKQFVEIHRGTVGIDSVEGKGTSVRVCLPVILPGANGKPAPFERTYE